MPENQQFVGTEQIPVQNSGPEQVQGAEKTQPGVSLSVAAVISLLCGLLFFFVIPAIPAVILGIVALRKIKKSNGSLIGKELAIIGIVLGVVGCFLLVFWARLLIIGLTATPNPEYMVANELQSIRDLRAIASAEEIWKKNDPDRNGIKDYWTYDVSCLYRMVEADNATRVSLIEVGIARADAAPANYNGGGKPFGDTLQIESWMFGANYKKVRSGYYFRAMTTDESGAAFNCNVVGSLSIAAANSDKFGFVAYPADYARTGVRTFIVNQSGMVYGTDTNGTEQAIIIQWPGEDPTQVVGPGGQNWTLIK